MQMMKSWIAGEKHPSIVITWPRKFKRFVCAHLQPSGHRLDAGPVPRVFIRDDAHLHQERDQHRLPAHTASISRCAMVTSSVV